MKKLFGLLFVFITMNAFSQLQDRIWIFGRATSGSTNATLYFGNLSNPVVTLPTATQPNSITTSNGFEVWSIVTNPVTGNLIFYTDGITVFNNLHQIIDLDTSTTAIEPLGADPSSSQPVAVAVEPKLPHENYILFLNGTGGYNGYSNVGLITYRIYNIINQSFSNILNLPGPYSTSTVTEGMKIVPSETDPSVMWLVTSLYPQGGITNRYVVYKIQQNIISYHNYFDFGPAKQSTTTNYASSPILNITYSNAIDTLGVSTVGFALQNTSRIFICKFNNTTGDFVTNTYKEYNPGFPIVPSVYDLEFSPNGRFLYYSVYFNGGSINTLYQLDLNDSVLTPTTIKNFSYKHGGGLQLGPDGLIYHIHDAGVVDNTVRLGRILLPDTKFITGTTPISSFYQENFMVYNNVLSFGLPEFLINPYNITNFSDNMNIKKDENVVIFPNPCSGQIAFITDQSFDVKLYDMQGRIVKQFKIYGKTSKNISDIPNGIYTVLLKNKQQSIVKKLVIQ